LDGIDANAASLEADLEAERRRSVELEQSLAAARRNTERLEADLDRDRERAERLAADLAAATERCTALAGDAERAAEARARMEGDLSAVRHEAGEERASAENLRGRFAELEMRAAKAEDARAAAAAELAGVCGTMERLSAEGRSARDLAEDADGRLGETLRSLEHMRAELGRANWRVGELSAEAERTREALDRERHITSETRVELESAEQEMDQLRRRQAELEAAENAARERADALLRDAENARRMMAEETERTRQAGADAARLAGEVDRMAEDLAAALRRAGEKHIEADVTGHALAALRNEVDALNAQRARLKEQVRSEQVRSGSLRADVDQLHDAERRVAELELEKETAAGDDSRLAALEEQLRAAHVEADREREACATQVAQIAAELEGTRSSLEVRQSQLQEYAANLGAIRRDHEQAEQRCEDLQAERDSVLSQLATAKDDLGRTRAPAVDGAELAQLKITAAKQAERIRELSGEAAAREPLLQSLTAQLEEREKRAAGVERKIKQLEAQIKEHESDAAAWNTEIKFRNARVAQLEEEIGKLRSQAVEPMSKGTIERRLSHSPAPVEATREIGQLKAQVDELNDVMGDKDAELLMLHTRSDATRRCLVRARQALQNVLSSGQVQSALALQLHDIIAAMERDGS
jgi:chromosome segregation ATPase